MADSINIYVITYDIQWIGLSEQTIDYRGFLMSLQLMLKLWRVVRQLGIVDG